MTDLNHVDLIGRVTKQPEFETKENGLQILRFSIAVNRDKKNKDTGEWYTVVTFINIAVFGATAVNLQKWLEKGKPVSIEGYIEEETWEKDGKKNSRLKVVPERINPFIERKVGSKDFQPEFEIAETPAEEIY